MNDFTLLGTAKMMNSVEGEINSNLQSFGSQSYDCDLFYDGMCLILGAGAVLLLLYKRTRVMRK